MPRVAMARHLQRFERRATLGADRFLKIPAFGERAFEIVARWKNETGFARKQQRLRLNRQLELEPQQTEHVGHHQTSQARPQLAQVAAQARE